MKRFLSSIALIIALLIGADTVNAQTIETPAAGEIMFILDASSSMLYTDGTNTTRMDKAKAALSQVVENLPSDTRVGLRVYGNTVGEADQINGCNDTSVISKPASDNGEKLSTAIKSIQAKGWTLMGSALQAVENDFTTEGPKTVILVSDGVERCAPPEPCDVAKTIASKGIDAKIHTVGLLVDPAARSQLQCIADNGNGTYYDVNDADRLQKALTALAEKEVSLFNGEGAAVRGSNNVLDAPALLPDTLYKDTITGEQILYYGFDALPKQKITVTIQAADNENTLGQLDYLRIKTYSKLDGSTLSAGGFFGASENFSRGTDIATTTFEIDTKKQGITEAQPIAFSVQVSNNQATVPLQIKVSAEGGEAPERAPVDESGVATVSDKADDNKTNGLPAWLIVLITLLVVAVLAGAAYVARQHILKKKLANQPTQLEQPPSNDQL